ncbi:MAG: hypothetical protein KDC32_20170, partial [Saprospiraceae bacterium]|nr:hypothetical protein [Saprospiraceae bacterium]
AAVGRRDHAYVDPVRLRTTQSLKFPFLQHAQEFRLQGQGQFADLIEEDRALSGQFEATDLRLDRPGKSPLFMAEQLAFDQVGR